MEHKKIANLLDATFDNVPRFFTKKWNKVCDHSGSAEVRYKPSKQTKFKTSVVRSDLCHYSDAYIAAKGDITLTKTENGGFINIRKTFLAFKNNAPFTDSFQ